MNRRSFLQAFSAVAGGLLLPREPERVRVYSFARELCNPGLEPDGQWYKLNITWDGVTTRCLVNDEVVSESSTPPSGGAYFERDPFSGRWQAHLGDPAQPLKGVEVTRGDILLDYMHARQGVGVASYIRSVHRSSGLPLDPPAFAPNFAPSILETSIKNLGADCRMRIGWSREV